MATCYRSYLAATRLNSMLCTLGALQDNSPDKIEVPQCRVVQDFIGSQLLFPSLRFLSPHTNRRSDDFGGPLRNRMTCFGVLQSG